jgi:NADPH-dependent 2,4-dienoyl-CoA reductase/sulfur reductase-like enzyme
MTVKKVVIVGGVAGGMSAATRLRRRSESTQIVVFDRGPYVSFANCGLPYHLGGEIADRNKLIVQSPERLRAVFNLDVRANSEVTAIDRAARQVAVTDRTTGREYREDYEHLILSPGAAPVVPPLPGIDRPGHFTLRTIPDMDGILAWVRSRDAKTACVVGGGYIGVEAAEQLRHLGLSVTLVEALPQILRPFDPEMVEPVHQELRSHGVALRLGHAVAGFEAAAESEQALASVVSLKNGTRVLADVVILALGVRPETTLAAESGLEIGPARGIKVDEYLRTSDPHVWAVGDAIEVTHGVTKRPSLIALAGPANRQGRLVADNIIGPPNAYPGTLGTAIVRVFRADSRLHRSKRGVAPSGRHPVRGRPPAPEPARRVLPRREADRVEAALLAGVRCGAGGASRRPGRGRQADRRPRYRDPGGDDRGRRGRSGTLLRPAIWVGERPGEPRRHGRPEHAGRTCRIRSLA